jgi:[ribosomal protein S18]-alanine N-acetyltransferase
MNPSWILRRLSTADLEKVVEVSQRAIFGIAWSREKLETEILEAKSLAIVDTVSGELLSFVLYRLLSGADGQVLEISWLATNPNHLRQGCMSTLYQALLAAESQANEVWLELHENNKEARNLYEKWGFQVTSRRPRYYSDGGAALLMGVRFT